MKMPLVISLFAILALAGCGTVDRVIAGPPVLYACADGSFLSAQPGPGRRHMDVTYSDEGRTAYNGMLPAVDADFGERFSRLDGPTLWLNESKALFIRPGENQALCQIQP